MNAFHARPLVRSVLVVLSALSFTGCSPSQGRTREPLVSNDANDAYVAQYYCPVPASGLLYTANERGRPVSVIDLSSGWVRTVATRIARHSAQISQDGILLLVVGVPPSEYDDAADGRAENVANERGELLLFDTASMSANGATRVKVGSAPAFVMLNKQARLAYATDAMDNNLSVIDSTEEDRQHHRDRHDAKRASHESRWARPLRCKYGGHSRAVIDLTQLVEVARIPVGKAPVQFGCTPKGRGACVSLRDEDSVVVIDTAQRKQIATVAVGRDAVQVFATPDGRYVYVANQGTEANRDGKVSVIDTADSRMVSTIETGKSAHGVVAGDDGRRAFVANIAGDSVSVIDTATRVVTDTIKVGQEPNGITFWAANR